MLNDYIENRKEMLKSLMGTFQFTRDQAKRIVGNRQWKTESAEIARLVFDGLMLYKNDVEGRLDELLDECMNEIKKAIEVDIRIVENQFTVLQMLFLMDLKIFKVMMTLIIID